MNVKDVLNQLLDHKDLSSDQMEMVMNALMSGETTDAQTAAILIALRAKGETIDEMTAAAKVMRSLSTKVEVEDKEHMVDTCGTGGDGINAFNISTASAFVAAAAGAKVAKHGGRSNAGKSGSADVLEAAGVNLDLSAEQVAECVKELGIGFMFAPAHHSAMKHVIGVRRELGVRTLFNILGPLANPAAAPNQVLGVYSKDLLVAFAKVLQALGSKRVMVVHAEDGMDEISIASLTHVAELKDGKITQWTIDPYDYDMDHVNLDDLAIDSAQESVNIITAVFANDDGAAKDIVCLNAGAAIYTAGLAEDYAEGVLKAKRLIAEGKVMAKFHEFINKTKAF
ncbi:anthranilate phosphoribosyltransferase [Hydrogenovibrio kuenenii]|uniref:anthranilate phosphoribosyltransferase n=1 Tax=Hydrogenovibrio kuenenii TaxID=63658 RepID=UPI000465C60A|nr:anthranilate phosphoribosyltransferase [Hydrogenovibrio kuenenii]